MKERIFRLIYELLDEYDLEVWEDIDYIELADFWVKMIKETSKRFDDLEELENLRKNLLYEYLFKEGTNE